MTCQWTKILELAKIESSRIVWGSAKIPSTKTLELEKKQLTLRLLELGKNKPVTNILELETKLRKMYLAKTLKNLGLKQQNYKISEKNLNYY